MYLGVAIAKSISNSLRFGTSAKQQQRKAQRTPPAWELATPLSWDQPFQPATSLSSQLSTPLSLPQATEQPKPLSLPQAKEQPAHKPEFDDPSESESRLAAATAQINRRRPHYQQLVEQILHKVSELEHTLYEDHQQEFKLRMALERQTERVEELNFSLDTEKQRNVRLVQLLRNVDTTSSADESESELLGGSRVPSAMDMYESISPLLMQQRYDELSASHKQSRRQLAKKEKALKLCQCEMEQLRGKYDHLFDEYRNEQKRFEMLCTRCLHSQLKKKQEVYYLKDAVGYASECIFHAQEALESCRGRIDKEYLKTFKQNLECFMCALRNCCCMRKLEELKAKALQEEERQQKMSQAVAKPSPLASCGSSTFVQRRPRRRRHKH